MGDNWEGPEIRFGLFQDGGRAFPVLGTICIQLCSPPIPLSPPFLIWTMGSARLKIGCPWLRAGQVPGPRNLGGGVGVNQAPSPPAMPREAGLTSDPQRQLPSNRGLAVPLHPCQSCLALLGLGLDLEEGQVRAQDGEKRKNAKNNSLSA